MSDRGFDAGMSFWKGVTCSSTSWKFISHLVSWYQIRFWMSSTTSAVLPFGFIAQLLYPIPCLINFQFGYPNIEQFMFWSHCMSFPIQKRWYNFLKSVALAMLQFALVWPKKVKLPLQSYRFPFMSLIRENADAPFRYPQIEQRSSTSG